MSGQGEDRLCWKNDSHKEFEVRLYYRALTPCVGTFPWKSIWKVKAPPRVAFFIWTASLGKILTMDNLQRRQIILVNWCCMCKNNGESVNHLLLHCPMPWELCAMVCSLFGVHWVMLARVLDLLSCWQGSLGRHQNGVIWKAFLIVSCGACGGKEMLGPLRVVKGTYST